MSSSYSSLTSLWPLYYFFIFFWSLIWYKVPHVTILLWGYLQINFSILVEGYTSMLSLITNHHSICVCLEIMVSATCAQEPPVHRKYIVYFPFGTNDITQSLILFVVFCELLFSSVLFCSYSSVAVLVFSWYLYFNFFF